jgi:large subunit ribosomal protein L29
MKREPLRDLTRAELLQKRGDLQDELFNLRMRQSTKSLENPLRLRVIGREIGRINTILREDELGIHRLAESKTSILGETSGKKSKTE